MSIEKRFFIGVVLLNIICGILQILPPLLHAWLVIMSLCSLVVGFVLLEEKEQKELENANTHT